ncbi:MAG: hypothetical protein HZA90_11305 [Verrucomicrobia bacterium]|nr:hypothetical protein [Verrucomicrobiota bacterium]
MKPNTCDRKAVALLACSALNAEATIAITRHLAACPACRGYFEEMSALAARHRDAARALPPAEISPQTRARVAAAIRRDSRRWPEEVLPGLGRRWMPVAAAAVVGLLLAGGAMLLLRRPLPPTLVVSQVAARLSSKGTTAPGSKFITYRLALNRSPEELDRLLTRDAGHSSADPTISFRSGTAWLDP